MKDIETRIIKRLESGLEVGTPSRSKAGMAASIGLDAGLRAAIAVVREEMAKSGLLLDETAPTRRIVCAALLKDGVLVVGPRHFDAVMWDQISRVMIDFREAEQGFIDQWGEFMNREDALTVATAAGQINVSRPKTSPATKLFSEDLY